MRQNFLFILLTILLQCQVSWSLCVSVDQANLRAKPSASSKLVWTVGKYMPLLPVTQKGPWIQVKDFEGSKMWIYASLVSDKIDCAVIKVAKSALRNGPGETYSLTPLSLARRYSPFKKLDRDGAWLQLQDDYGYKHWVYEENLWEPLAYTHIDY